MLTKPPHGGQGITTPHSAMIHSNNSNNLEARIERITQRLSKTKKGKCMTMKPDVRTKLEARLAVLQLRLEKQKERVVRAEERLRGVILRLSKETDPERRLALEQRQAVLTSKLSKLGRSIGSIGSIGTLMPQASVAQKGVARLTLPERLERVQGRLVNESDPDKLRKLQQRLVFLQTRLQTKNKKDDRNNDSNSQNSNTWTDRLQHVQRRLAHETDPDRRVHLEERQACLLGKLATGSHTCGNATSLEQRVKLVQERLARARDPERIQALGQRLKSLQARLLAKTNQRGTGMPLVPLTSPNGEFHGSEHKLLVQRVKRVEERLARSNDPERVAALVKRLEFLQNRLAKKTGRASYKNGGRALVQRIQKVEERLAQSDEHQRKLEERLAWLQQARKNRQPRMMKQRLKQVNRRLANETDPGRRDHLEQRKARLEGILADTDGKTKINDMKPPQNPGQLQQRMIRVQERLATETDPKLRSVLHDRLTHLKTKMHAGGNQHWKDMEGSLATMN